MSTLKVNTLQTVAGTNDVAVSDIAKAADLAAPSGASLVGYMPAGVGATATDVQSKLRERVSVLDFYANGVSGPAVDPTGVIDSTLGIQAALNYAKSKVTFSLERFNYVTVEFPNFGTSIYKITASLRVYSGITIEGNGVTIACYNTTYPRITGSTAVPDSADIAGQVGGGAFCDLDFGNPTAVPEDTRNLTIRNIQVQNSRWAIIIAGRAVSCDFDGISTLYCDGAIFMYGAMQTGRIHNLQTSATYIGFVGGATGTSITHPWKAMDTNFIASPIITNDGHPISSVYSLDFDNWFKNSILRPTIDAYRSNINFGVLTYNNPDAVNISGRFIYLPSRTKNGNQDIVIKGQVAIPLPRSLVYIARVLGGRISDVAAEGFAIDPSVIALGAEVNFIEHYLPSSCFHENITTEIATPGAIYNKTIHVSGYVGSSNFDGTNLVAINVVGKFDASAFKLITGVDTSSLPFKTFPNIMAVRNTVDNTSISSLYNPSEILLSSSDNHKLVSAAGDVLGVTHYSARLPKVGGVQNRVRLWSNGYTTNRDITNNFNGKLTVYCQDLTTGLIDFGEFIIQIASRYASSTISVAANIGDTTITVADTAAQVHYHAGDIMTVGTENYLVKSSVGNTMTFCTPLTANYAIGVAVTGVVAIRRTLVAPTLNYFTITASDNTCVLTSTRSTSFPIKLFMKLESFKDMNEYAL